MKITVFTSNQPRHLALVNGLSRVADEVFAVHECKTIFPGRVKDFFGQSPVMQRYFARVIAAEEGIFGTVGFLGKNVRQLSIRPGDLNLMSLETLGVCLESDLYIVFGSSYIKGALIDFLVGRKAINIHMGVSPYYRGSSCNFWASYDGNLDLVGATIHYLSKGLDNGPILYHALPPRGAIEPFDLGMLAVKAAHLGLIDRIARGEIHAAQGVPQDKALEIRYTRSKDFNDQRADAYLENLLTPDAVRAALLTAPDRKWIDPYIMSA
jgi:hypothetical protein